MNGVEFLEKEGIEDMVMAIDELGEWIYASCLITKALGEQKERLTTKTD